MKSFIFGLLDRVVWPLIVTTLIVVLGVLGFGPTEWGEWMIHALPEWAKENVIHIVAFGIFFVVFVLMIYSKCTRWRYRRELLLRTEEYVSHTNGRILYVQDVCAEHKEAEIWYNKLNTQRINLSDILVNIDQKQLSERQISALQRLKISHQELDSTITELLKSSNFTALHIAHLYKGRAERLSRSLNDFIHALSGYFHDPRLVEAVKLDQSTTEGMNLVDPSAG